jgi:hypothetical protein
MRENRTSGLMRGSNGIGDSRPLLSTLLVLFFLLSFSQVPGAAGISSSGSGFERLVFRVRWINDSV